MTQVEDLKRQISAALVTENSTELLLQIQELLNNRYPLVPAGVEAHIAEAMADVAAGKTVTLDEFLEHGKRESEKRKAKYTE